MRAKEMRETTPSVMLYIGITLLCLAIPVQAATTEIHVVKYASDETTVLNEMTVAYSWMEANLPVQGDGVTHYYQQGPVFDSPPGPWDENETANLKDKGVLKGTDLIDLCNLVGGMSAGDEIKIKASDGFYRWFGYTNVYEPQSCQGPIVLCWYKDGDRVPDFEEGLQIVFFADDNVFGNWDMHESLAPEYRYNYSGVYPSANGLSVKWISEIAIYSTMDPPELRSIEVSPVDATLDIGCEKQFTGAAYDQYASEMSDIVFTWTSSDETVGTIDATGLFTALAVGETVITAKRGGVQGTASVTVSSPAPTASLSSTPTPSPVLTTIAISPAATLNVGKTQQFTGVAYDQDHCEMSDIVFVWTSSAEVVGTIDAAGLFTALAAGETTIMAENGAVDGVASVTVSSPIAMPTPSETQSANMATSPPPTPTQSPPIYKPTRSLPTAPKSSGVGVLSVIGLLAISYLIKRREV